MPTNEQYIEAARRKLKPFQITIDAAENAYYVSFMNQTPDCRIRDPISVTQEEAEAVALYPKQEHDCQESISGSCPCVRDTYSHGYEADKASLKPFDVDALPERKPWNAMKIAEFATSYYDAESEDAYQLAKELEQKFEAPERKSWACTQKQADTILNKMRDKGILAEHYDEAVALRHVINEVLGLHTAPVEAEPACPDCEHSEGLDQESHDLGEDYCAFTCICTNQFHHERGTV